MSYYKVTIHPSPLARTAGEVRFVKDKSDANNWAFDDSRYQSERFIDPNDPFFNSREVEPLVATLKSLLMALGHTMSGYTRFSKIKSRRVSPDGMLGGKGYILKMKDIRSLLMNSVEALSAVTDTLYDEVNAPHWKDQVKEEQVETLLEDVEEIKGDPEQYAVEEEREEVRKTAAKRVLFAHERLKSQVTVHSESGNLVWRGTYKEFHAALPLPEVKNLMVAQEVYLPEELVDGALFTEIVHV